MNDVNGGMLHPTTPLNLRRTLSSSRGGGALYYQIITHAQRSDVEAEGRYLQRHFRSDV